MTFDREKASERLDEIARAKHPTPWLLVVADLRAALAEIERLEYDTSSLRMELEGKEQCRLRENTELLRRAEQAEARAAALQSELDAAWFGIERSFEIEPREVIEREAKSNGFKFGLAQAVHTIWKREPKVADALNRTERLTEALNTFIADVVAGRRPNLVEAAAALREEA